ncbi:MAG: prolyl oligopeptidase family serine peptidase, partial [Anaerolineaceae bacterium]
AVAVFPGSEDKVGPPSQSESMLALMRANRVPHIYRVYEGEGHGFRKAENISAFYADMERFIQQYVIFSA